MRKLIAILAPLLLIASCSEVAKPSFDYQYNERLMILESRVQSQSVDLIRLEERVSELERKIPKKMIKKTITVEEGSAAASYIDSLSTVSKGSAGNYNPVICCRGGY